MDAADRFRFLWVPSLCVVFESWDVILRLTRIPPKTSLDLSRCRRRRNRSRVSARFAFATVAFLAHGVLSSDFVAFFPGFFAVAVDAPPSVAQR